MTYSILVRHGQTEWNRVERFRGRADVPLNETGLAQAEATGLRIYGEWLPSAVYSSPLSRAVRTAETIANTSICLYKFTLTWLILIMANGKG